jgi:hypothetical protein
MTHVFSRALVFAGAALALAGTAHAGPFDAVSLASDTSLATYEKVYIAPVNVDFGDQPIRRNIRDLRGLRPVSDRDQALKADDLADDLQREFGKRYILVDAPGEDVLTVETTLTKLVSSRPTIADRRDASVNLDFRSIYAGGADYLVTLREGDQLIGTIEENHTRNTSLNDGRVRAGIWQDADRSFSQFSRQLARYVQKN